MADHFDTALDDEQHDQGHGGQESIESDEYIEHEEVPKKGWRPSAPVVIVIVAALSMGGMFAYKKLIAPSPAASYVADDSHAEQADGMMAQNGPPHPEAVPQQVAAPVPVEPPPTAQAPSAPAASQAPAPQAPSPPPSATAPAEPTGAKGMAAGAAPTAAPATESAKGATASASTNESAKDAEIAKLKSEIYSLRRAQHRTAGAAVAQKPSAAAKKDKADKGKNSTPSDSIQLGYKIKQIVPGQAWVENEAGRVQVIAVGDTLAGSEVTKIDADNFRITTTAGVIK